MNYGCKAPNRSKYLGVPYIHFVPYRAGSKWRELEHKIICIFQEANVTKTAVTELAFPVVFSPKKHGSLHLSVN